VAAFYGFQMLETSEQPVTSTDSGKADVLIDDKLSDAEVASETVIVVSERHDVDDLVYSRFVGDLAAEVEELDFVTGTVSYYEVRDQSMVSQDRHTTLVNVTLTGKPEDAIDIVDPLISLVEERSVDGFEVYTVGDGSTELEIEEAFHEDLLNGETIGIPIALIVLVIVFGAAVAAGVPMVLALLGIVAAMGLTGAVSQVLPINSFVMNLVTMIGLAVGIDYSLFIVQRFREERRKGLEKVDAIVAAGNTATRAVVSPGSPSSSPSAA
jgi:RND superfamily putative drug exporter